VIVDSQRGQAEGQREAQRRKASPLGSGGLMLHCLSFGPSFGPIPKRPVDSMLVLATMATRMILRMLCCMSRKSRSVFAKLLCAQEFGYLEPC
jgi:hypothetical protein